MKPASSPTLAVHEISLYNTGRISPEKIIAAFAARVDQFKRIIADIDAEQHASRAQHHLIVGQRGMGKTMLLARIAAELRTQPEFSARFIPLVFAEEQYAVDRLSKFWLNCLDSLADAREAASDTAAVRAIDATVDSLQKVGVRATKDDQPFADEVYKAFVQAAQATGQRPVLLVDNLQLVFERLDAGQQHSLRELLMRPGSPILIGASPSPPPQSQDYGAAFYDHFKVHYLRALEETEMRALLLHLAKVAQRDDVRQRVLEHPARLTVLRQLTGGNPRTTLTLFFLYAEDFAPSVFGDLEGLLDRVTPLYKARFEELTAQQQVIASAIANHWDPVTASTLAVKTGLPTGTISAQLDRLEKTGVIERTELFGETRIGYLLAERFFNIWFLMRSASRRQRRQVEFLTRFLESFYEPTDRSRIARHLMGEDHFSPDRYIWSCAVAASLTEPEMAQELTRHTELTALREEAREARARLHELIDFDSLPPATLAFDDLRKKLMSLVPDGVDITPEDFALAVLGDRAMFKSGEREQLAARSEKLNSEDIQSVLDAVLKARSADQETYSKEATVWFHQRLASGQIRNLRDAEDWNRAFHQVCGESCIPIMLDTLPFDIGGALSQESIDCISTSVQPKLALSSIHWGAWGADLHFKLNRYPEAEVAYRRAIELHPDDIAKVAAEEAEVCATRDQQITSRMATTDLLQSTDAGRRLDKLVAERIDLLVKMADGLARLRKELSNALDLTWQALGLLLSDKLQRYTEAAAAYREAIICDRNNPMHWINLAVILADHLQNYDEAEIAFREALALDPEDASPWILLGNLYCDYLDRPLDAIDAFDKALRLDPEDESAHHNRLFLHRDFMGEGAAARALSDSMRKFLTDEYSDTTHLQEALFAAYDSNWGLAQSSLSQALDIRTDGFIEYTADDWLRASAVLLHLNYGAELLLFLDQRGDTVARLRPWVEALRALQAGDRRALQNIAPEIRTTAETFYDGITRRLGRLPEKTRRRSLPKVKRVSRK